MKIVLTILLIAITTSTLLFTSSCRKGRNLPENVPVYIDTTGIHLIVDDVYSEAAGCNRDYITEDIRESLCEAFYQDLRYFLKKNNCISVTDEQMYTVKVDRVSLQEAIYTHCYIDSCLTSCSGPVYWDSTISSGLSYTSKVEVFTRDGGSLGAFTAGIEKKEKKCGRDSCNKPGYSDIRMGASKMRTRVTKQQRKNITKVIYKHWKETNP